MVRTYKLRNRLCKFSKLSEAETLAIIGVMVRGPWHDPGNLPAVSQKTLRRHRQAFADHLVNKREFRRVVFQALDKMGLFGLSRLQHFNPAAPAAGWDQVHKCIFRCPSIIQPALLAEASRRRTRRTSDPTLILSVIGAQPIEPNDDRPIRRDCVDCHVIGELSIDEYFLLGIAEYGELMGWTSRKQVLKLLFVGSISYGVHRLARGQDEWNPNQSGRIADAEQFKEYLDKYTNYIMQHIYEYMQTDPMTLRR